jgi:deazaflavin-dependent oxidoreductase (nitroreductase family)
VRDSDTPTRPTSAPATSVPATAPLATLVEADSRPRLPGVLLGRLFELPLIGPFAARMARAPNRSPFVRTFITPFHARLLRRTGGRLRRSWLFAAGQPVLSLTTIGRRTGRPRSTVVTCFTYGDDLGVAGMNLGIASNPAWALNLQANPQAAITLRTETIAVTARRATGEEAARLWQRWVEVQPSARAFRDLAGRDIPLFVLTPRD